MNPRALLIAIVGIVVLLLAIVFGVTYFSGQNAINRQNSLNRLSPSGTSSPSPAAANSLPDLDASPTPSPAPVASLAPTTGGVVGNYKTYNTNGIYLRYPKDWGLLTCSNSYNFEFDPTNSTDQLNVACNTAIKPVTVIVRTGSLSCAGETKTMGNYSVVKSRTIKSDGDVWYRWCVNNVSGYSLDISHRVSSNVEQATSQEDFSSQVEEIISSLNTAAS